MSDDIILSIKPSPLMSASTKRFKSDSKLPALIHTTPLVEIGKRDEKATSPDSNDSISTHATTPTNATASSRASSTSDLDHGEHSSAQQPTLVTTTKLTTTPAPMIRCNLEDAIREIFSDEKENDGTLYKKFVFYAGAAGLSGVTFICVILPTAALGALVALATSTCLLVIVVVRYVRRQYQIQVVRQGRGLGEILLPSSIYKMLTQTTLHEFMTDDTFMKKNRHLLLYFLPLPEDKLQKYVDQLAPDHRVNIRRPGLGHLFLGPDAMRLIEGRRKQEEEEAIYGRPPSEAIVVTKQRQLLFDDDESSLGLELSPNDLVGGLDDAQVLAMGNTLGLPTNISAPAKDADRGEPTKEPLSEDELEMAYDKELAVLTDAVVTYITDFVYAPIVDYATSVFLYPAAGIVARCGFSVAVLLTGFGLWTSTLPARSPHTRHTKTAWMSAAVSGSVGFVALGMRYYWRPPPASSNQNKK